MPQRLAQHLLSRGLLKAAVIDEALKRMQRMGSTLDTVLLEMGAISEAGMLQAISDVSGVRLVNLADFEPNREAAALVPVKMARQLCVVPLSLDGSELHLASAYPIPRAQLKDVGFLLSRRLELWVALEARIRDWQATVYSHDLEPRFARLLAQLDPHRRAAAEPPRAAPGELAPEVLETIAQGVAEEPLLLAQPKRKPKAAAPQERTALVPQLEVQGVGLGEEVEDPHTTVLDPTAYSRFASQVAEEAPAASLGDDEQDSTRVMDMRGYENFGKEMSRLDRATTDPEVPALKVPASFPGVVLPPRRSVPPPPSIRKVVDTPLPMPAGAPRLQAERVRPGARPGAASSPSGVTAPPAVSADGPRPPTTPFGSAAAPAVVAKPRPAAPPPEARARPAAPADETDFGDVNEVIVSQSAVRAEVPPEPENVIPRSSSASAIRDQPLPTGVITAKDIIRKIDAKPRTPAAPQVPPPPPPEVKLRASPARAEVPTQTASAAPAEPPPPAPPPSMPVVEAVLAEPAPPVAPPPTAPDAVSADAAAAYDAGAVPSWMEPPATAQAAPPPEVMAAPEAEAQARWANTAAVDAEGQPIAPRPPSMETPLPASSPVWGATSTAQPDAAPQAPAGSEVLLPSPPGLSPSPANEWTLAQARASLKEVTTDREALVHVILEYGRRAFEYVAAFAVMRGTAVGWDARGDGDVSAIRNLAVPLDAASVFRTVALTRGSYVGPLPPDALTQHYLHALGRQPRTVFMWPVEVKSRLVAIFYGDCGSRPVSQRRLSDFILFCQDLPAAFHELILYRKQNPKAAQAFAPDQLKPMAEQLEQRGTEDEWLRDLITLLTGPDATHRAMAMQELAQIPDRAALALAQAFPGPTGWSRLPVSELPDPDELGPLPGALARLGQAGAVALAPLLDSSDSDARYLALLTAGSLRFPEVVDGVVRALFDLEPDISSAARAAVAALKYLPELLAKVPVLRRDLASADSLRRSLAARALGVLHDRDSIDGLINLTASEDTLCAQSAAEALRETTRQNFGTQSRAWTAWWAGARGKRRLEWLVDALDSPEYEIRLGAIEELSRAFGDNAGYFADGTEAERAPTVAAWRSFVASRPDLEL